MVLTGQELFEFVQYCFAQILPLNSAGVWVKCTDETLPNKGFYFVKIGPLKDKVCWSSSKIIERYNELKFDQNPAVDIYYLDESLSSPGNG